MCLGIPMQIREIDGFVARCEAKGVSRDVNLFLLQGEPVEHGDFVMVHVGYAIQKLDPEEADRYQAASALAGRYCADLETRFPDALSSGGGLRELRAFFRLPQGAKIGHIRARSFA